MILARPERGEFMDLAKALAAVRKTPVQDQVVGAKHAMGVIAKNVTADEGQRLVEQLRAARLDVALVPGLADLPKAEPLTRLDAGIGNNLSLIAAAAITVTSTTTKTVKEGPSAAQKLISTGILLTTGLPIKVGGRERSVQKTQSQSDLAFFADLHYENPARRLRIDASHFDYAFLKERKLYPVMGNFKLLLSDLAQSAPEAWRNHGARILLDGKSLSTMGYESLADLERESRWLLTLQRRLGGRPA